MDDLAFARAQMGVSLAFHIVFAVIGIGMPALMVISEALWLRTRQPTYLELTRRWARGTTILFAVGAVSGTVLAALSVVRLPLLGLQGAGSIVSHRRAAAFWLLLAAGSPPTLGQDPLNCSYVVDGVAFTLRDGRAERALLHVSGQPVFADLDGDGARDAAVTLVYEPGGSGTFFYLAAAVRSGPGYWGSNAVRVGDRITPIELRVEGGTIIYTYADRLPHESFTARPSVVRSKRMILKGGTLQELP